MFWVLTAFVIFLLMWGMMWRSQPRLAFGIVIGLVIGAIASRWIGPYESITDVPIWLPAVPFAVVAVGLLVYGGLTWWMLGDAAEED